MNKTISRIEKFGLVLLILAGLLPTRLAMAVSGNISDSNKYAWSENVGWINFNPKDSQVTIDPSTGSFDGYAWAENVGWIHFESSWPSIPTLSGWGMIIFMILTGMTAVYYLRRNEISS